MDLSMLRKMKMGDKSKPEAADGMLVGIGLGKPKSDSGAAESDLADASEMDLLDELRDRGCVDDDMYSAISEKIKSGEAKPEAAEGSPEEEASESPAEEKAEDESKY